MRRIEYLKIDAQGSDFSILRELLENAPSIAIDNWQVECQFYDRAPPFYPAQNDCSAILEYVRKRLPMHTTRSHVGNCQAAEYNLVSSMNKEGTSSVFKETAKSEKTPGFKGGLARNRPTPHRALTHTELRPPASSQLRLVCVCARVDWVPRDKCPVVGTECETHFSGPWRV